MNKDVINIILANIFKITNILNIKPITNIKFLLDENFVKITTDDDTKYYISITQDGNVEKVFKDYKFGELLYFSGAENVENSYQNDNDMVKQISNLILNELECPFCGSFDLLKYKYGEPTMPIDENKYILGGCVIDGRNPKYKCKKCGKDIFLEDIKNNQVSNLNLSRDELINKTVNKIDKMIDNLESKIETDNNNYKNNIDINNNLEVVKNYSILNKSIEELLNAKNKFINDWYNLLINTFDEQWIANSGIYRIHICSIIDCILRYGNDTISKKQLELLNEIGKTINFPNKLAFISLVIELKRLEQGGNNISLCPHCNNSLTFIEPANSLLYCRNCNKYFENNDGKVGKSVKEPNFNPNVFY